MHYRVADGPFAADEILDSYASTPEAGPEAVVDAEAQIQLLSISALIYDLNDGFSDNPTPAVYLAAVAALFPDDAVIKAKYAATFDTTELLQGLVLPVDRLSLIHISEPTRPY